MRVFKGRQGAIWSYDPESLLGRPGAFGRVYEGYRHDGSKLAVKVVSLQEGDDAERQQRDRELEIASRLSSVRSDHLLVPIDYGYEADDLFIVMAFAERSLKEAIDQGLDKEQQYLALLDVALGLQELSEAGVLHRDLKSRNVLAHEGIWKIADFGISRDLSHGTATFTFVVHGSRPYMAPELWQMQPATVKTDLYAYGCLAFEVLTGQVPFLGPNQGALREQHLRAQPPALPAHVDPRLARLVLRLLAKEPMSRPQDARAVVEELRQIGTPQTATQTGISDQLLAYQERQAGDEAREREDRAAAEARKDHRQQALSDLDELLANVYSFLNNAIPDLRMQDLDPSSLPRDMHAELGRRFVVDDIVLEFHVWPGDAEEWRKILAGVSEPHLPTLTDDPIVCAGRIVTDVNLRGDQAWKYINIRTLANLVARVEAGRLQWYQYRYIYTAGPQDKGYVAANLFDRNRIAFNEGRPFGWMAMPFWIVYLTRDTRFEVEVEPLGSESIAKLVRELLH